MHVRLKREHLLQLGLSPEQRTYGLSATHNELQASPYNKDAGELTFWVLHWPHALRGRPEPASMRFADQQLENEKVRVMKEVDKV